ncbi:hypothetical protein EEB11_18865 [Pseudotabrizicola sediminis]|uniref:ATP-grasp domain-containing protein n=1 Tax=Pseudotabrizicola sediminis TaxID=2486418 RepID=A0ABY2KGM3_9RHOB|nr:hypothetical protein [Pseudotabrizicola sediminis]TGD41347.1 hypothetical protein EEB11_18865 [Pseudotabrizicola sediminis]
MANPLTPIDVFLPDDAAFMARTELSQMRRLGMNALNLDTVTGHALGVIGRRPSVRHQACVTDEILAFLTDAGLPILEDIRVYRHADQAERHADGLIASGYRLFGPYPLREGRFVPQAQLVPSSLWRSLNSKANLGQLVPSEHLAPRWMWREGGVPELPTGGVYLKYGGTEATGVGHCVRYCPDADSFARALDWFRAEGCADQLVMEQAIDTDITWCANVSVTETGCLYLGAAEQLLNAPGQQSGSMIDPDFPFPQAGIDLVIHISEVARARGYLGIAGFDIGRAVDGQLIVFDPNFRINACTGQVLLHPAASTRSGLGVSRSFHVTSKLAADELMNRLTPPIADGWLVPTRVIDGRWLDADAPPAACTGFVLGRTREEAAANLLLLKTMV